MPRGGNHSSKPAGLKALEGNRSKVSAAKLQRLIEREPKGVGKPVVPAHLAKDEQEEFRHVLKTAPAANLTACDQALVENYCVAVCAAREAHGKLLQTGKLVRGPNGPMLSPFWRLWEQSVELSRMMGSELGLSPASRSRIQSSRRSRWIRWSFCWDRTRIRMTPGGRTDGLRRGKQRILAETDFLRLGDQLVDYADKAAAAARQYRCDARLHPTPRASSRPSI